MKKQLSLLVLNSLNLKTELGSCKILFQSNYLLKEFSLLFFTYLNLKTDLLVLCSSSLFKFFVQVFISSLLFKYCVQILKKFCSCKIKLYDKRMLSLFLNSLNLKTELGSCKILCQSNYLLKEFSLLFFNFLNLKTDRPM